MKLVETDSGTYEFSVKEYTDLVKEIKYLEAQALLYGFCDERSIDTDEIGNFESEIVNDYLKSIEALTEKHCEKLLKRAIYEYVQNEEN